MRRISRGILSFINKWKRVRKDILKERRYSYHGKYWTRCGYCRSFSYREIIPITEVICPLYSGQSVKYDGLRYCHPSGNLYSSVARKALEFADKCLWEVALEYVDILLAKMNRDLIKYEKTGKI